MTPQMESIIQSIASFREALIAKQREVQEEEQEIIDDHTFCAVLSGLPSFRRLPGVPEHMGFDLVWHCDTEEHAKELREYLDSVFGIRDEQTLVAQKMEFFHFFNEYYDFACEWDGHPNFQLSDLDEEGAHNYTVSRDFSTMLRNFVGPHGYLAWEIGERIMLIRAACACELISDETCIRLAIEEANAANEVFDNFIDFAISALCGCVYFMFVSMGRTEDEGLSGFLDINLKIVSRLFEDDIWSFNAWCEKHVKQLAIQDDQVQALLGMEYQNKTGIATDRVLCDGYRISVMVREEPMSDHDTGWRFFAGDEDQEYIENGRNFGELDLNLIVNYSQDTIKFLEEPVGTLVMRADNGELEIVPMGTIIHADAETADDGDAEDEDANPQEPDGDGPDENGAFG